MTTASPSPARRTTSNLSRRIIYGVLAGAAVGVFLGEYATVLQVISDAYIRLLQMTVLPYVTISIISGLGALDFAEARRLGTRVGAVLALLWAMALVAVLLVVVMFPPHASASFFSTTMLQEREGFDFLGLYIPTNPFNSLANNIVPAVVLFSIVVGLALIPVPRKERLIEVLRIAAAAIGNATDFIVWLTPYGVFAIAAVVAGTIGFDTLKRLQVYLISYVSIALLLSLWVLPGLVAALTPVPFRALMSRTRDALIMAFMTTSLFAVLPLLTEHVKALLREHAPGAERDEALPDVIVPVSFNFPHTGKLLSLSFVLFAAWFSDTRLGIADYPRLVLTGLVVMFGNVNAAIPFLLDFLHIPSDTFGLFITSGIVNARFGTLVAAMHTLTIALLGTCAVAGTLRPNARKLVRFGIITAVLTVVTVGGLRVLLQVVLHTPYDMDQVIANMEAIRDRAPARTFKPGEPVAPLPPITTTMVDRIHQRGLIRVGYLDDNLPYTYFNRRGDLVGLDVEMAEQLAQDLGVGVEFVPVTRNVFDDGLDASVCDVLMSGAAITADRVLHVQFSQPYLDETVAFVVPDHLASQFGEWSSVRAMRGLRVGVPPGPYFKQRVQQELPDAQIVTVDSFDDMFRPHTPRIDAFMLTAERGSAYTILHPEYSVVVPKPRPQKVPLAYVVAGRDRDMSALLDAWIDLKRKDGTIDELFAHWILGQQTTPKEPRWSVVRNVLHLVP
jgi:Na+/H+-dicarboxylate symporter/ABC-type amino acid transport substrate-binding protein